MRGRVMALYMMVFMGGTPIGPPLLGWIAETFGARWTLIGGGGLTILGTLLAVALFTCGRGSAGPAPRAGRRPGRLSTALDSPACTPAIAAC